MDTNEKVFPIRHMDFNFNPDEMAKYCVKDSAFRSAFVLTFSALIPNGEKLVINTLRHYRPKITDPVLKARVTGLIGQEAMHSKVHEEFNMAYETKGIPMKKIDKAGEIIFTKVMPFLLPNKLMLGITCAIEHSTALMAEQAFNEPERIEELDGPAREFLLWHLLEECEHKSVAYDVYQDQVNSLWIRRLSMPVMGFFGGILFAYSMPKILKIPGFSQGKKSDGAGRQEMFGKGGYWDSLRPKILAFNKPDFHPDKIDTSDILEEWREKIFGENGSLKDKVTKTVLPAI